MVRASCRIRINSVSIRIGTLVFANDFRHPVMLAKEAASLDVLSGGRLVAGTPLPPPAAVFPRYVEKEDAAKA